MINATLAPLTLLAPAAAVVLGSVSSTMGPAIPLVHPLFIGSSPENLSALVVRFTEPPGSYGALSDVAVRRARHPLRGHEVRRPTERFFRNPASLF
jgi:hypothetical protein